MKLLLVVLVSTCLLLEKTESANILVMLPMPLFSHTNAYLPIIEELANRGHSITFYSPFPPAKQSANIKHVQVKNLMPEPVLSIADFLEKGAMVSIVLPFFFWGFSVTMNKQVFEDPAIVQLIQDKEAKFDLVMGETFFIQEPMVAFGHRFSAPVINFQPAPPTPWVSYLTGTPHPYSYVPGLSSVTTDHMTFIQRLKNTLESVFELFFSRYYYLPQLDTVVREGFGQHSSDMPSLLTMLMNTSLTLVDAHFSLNYPRPYHNNIIEVGGISTHSQIKPFEKDLEKFVDGADQGIIYFSTGSWLRSSNLSQQTIGELVSGFSRLKQRVLWKWDGPPMEHKPDNVYTAKWFPQNTVLSHPKCKLFMTHGGAHSVYESLSHDVPILGVPVMGDQLYNIKFVEDIEAGLKLDLLHLTADQLVTAVNKVIDDPKYKENAVRRGQILKDRPMLVLKNAVYWIEYVIRHKGAAHLRPAALDISWCSYLLLDVLTAVGLVTVAAFMILLAFCRLCCSCRRSQPPARVTKTKKTN